MREAGKGFVYKVFLLSRRIFGVRFCIVKLLINETTIISYYRKYILRWPKFYHIYLFAAAAFFIHNHLTQYVGFLRRGNTGTAWRDVLELSSVRTTVGRHDGPSPVLTPPSATSLSCLTSRDRKICNFSSFNPFSSSSWNFFVTRNEANDSVKEDTNYLGAYKKLTLLLLNYYIKDVGYVVSSLLSWK